jgi:hypothetical protein
MPYADSLACRPLAIAAPVRLTTERSVLDHAIATYQDLGAAADDGMCGDVDFDIEAAHRKLAEIKARMSRMRGRLN